MKTLADLFDQLAARDRPDLLWHRDGAAFRPISSADFVATVERCARALWKLGVRRGDRVGLVAHNRPEWHTIDFAAHRLGAVPVPLFGTLTPPQVRYILDDSGCHVVAVEGDRQLAKLEAERQRLTAVRYVVRLEPLEDDAEETDAVVEGAFETVSWEELLSLGEGVEADLSGPAAPDELATIIYTSGTTGTPKGVMLTHRNVVSNCEALLQVLPPQEGDKSLSVLPLCHVFQRTVDYTYLNGGVSVAYGSPQRLGEDLLLVRPTSVIGVPRLWERFRDAVLERVEEQGALARRLFAAAERVGLKRARAELAGEPFGLADRLQHAVLDGLVLRKVRSGAGGGLRYFVSGGAALDPDLNWWFEAMGLRLIQGYGLTESSPVITVNPLEANRIGTVGLPLPGVEVAIAEDGEILTRGPHVMKGYWNQPQATAETVVGGWLHTGDIGRLDDDGYLVVTDRKKHLLRTSTGKYVAPQALENALTQSPYIEQVLVVGDDRKFVAGLVVPSFGALRRWARGRGLPEERDALVADPRVRELFGEEIDRRQADFAPHERVRAFRLLDEPFSIEGGTLTPTLKTVRREVEARYAGFIDEMYRQAEVAHEVGETAGGSRRAVATPGASGPGGSDASGPGADGDGA